MLRRDSRLTRMLLLVVVIALAYGAKFLFDQQAGGALPSIGGDPVVTGSDDSEILRLYRNKISGVMTSASGTVERVLADDNEGSRHQRMILRLRGGHTLMISHNIDLAPRVPARAGDRLAFRGQFEWNERGGVVHRTHHDPQGRLAGGWLRHDGEQYE